jgi:hypothetical protein
MDTGRKGTLYAPRLKGDIEPGLEPSRLGGDDAKAWARMDFPGLMIPGQSDQLITAASTTQKFEIGTRRVEYGRTFRYSRAGELLSTAGRGRLARFGNWVPDGVTGPDVDGFYGDLYGTASIGDTYVDLEMADTSETYAANYFQGGYVLFFNGNFCMHYIVKSDASGALYCRIYLDHPLTQDVGTTQGVEVYCSPYRKIMAPATGATYTSFAGMLHCDDVASGSYFWLQTRGPCWITPTGWSGTTCPGYAANYREVYGVSDGTIQPGQGTPVIGCHRVGYLISRTESAYGDVFIMLMLE